ncbi:hypothetical protein, partial [uncultured Thalassospira sp.]|uniref:hypothetical protein n=1 Tax=uncultured Thalassospira sp. TaxID=404382 RepID=UPI0025878BDA
CAYGALFLNRTLSSPHGDNIFQDETPFQKKAPERVPFFIAQSEDRGGDRSGNSSRPLMCDGQRKRAGKLPALDRFQKWKT